MAITFLPQARAVIGDQTLNFAPLNAGLDSVIQGNRQNALMRQNQEQFDARQGLQERHMNQNALIADRRMALAEAEAKRAAALDPYRQRLSQAQAAQADMQGRIAQQRQEMLQGLFAPPQQAAPAPAPAMPQQQPAGDGRSAQPAVAPAIQGGGPAWFERLSPTQKDAARIAAANGDWSKVSEIVAASGKPSLTPAQTAIDKKFAGDYAEYVAGGGFADVQKNIQQLESAIGLLKSDKATTGPMTGLAVQSNVTGGVFAPNSLEVKQQVEEIVQRNLREVLGGQFAQKEGDALIARAYNPFQPEEMNVKRLNRLLGAIKKAARAKQAAVKYFETNGTLQGFKGLDLLTHDGIAKAANLEASNRSSSQDDGGGANPYADMSDDDLKKVLGQ